MKPIGVYHQIDLEGLDLAAELRGAGASPSEIKARLTRLARQKGVGEQTAKKRTQVAKSAWGDNGSLVVRRAAALYKTVQLSERLALHVAVIVRAYPFFLDVLDQAGTQVRLGGVIRQGTVRDRLQRKYGSKTNVYQGVQKVLQSLVSWGALSKIERAGEYVPRPPHPVPAEVGEVLAAGILEGSARTSAPWDEIRNHPALFLFKVPGHMTRDAPLRESRDGSGRRLVEFVESLDA